MPLANPRVCAPELPQQWFEASAGPFELKVFRSRTVSAFAPEMAVWSGDEVSLWTFEMEAAPMGREATLIMEAWFHRLARRDWAFTAWDPLRQLPRGAGNGYSPGNDEILFDGASFASDFRILEGSTTALVKTAAARGADTLLAKGFDPALAGQAVLKFGDQFSVGLPGEMNLHMAAADAICDANGETRIELANRLWKPALPGDLIEMGRPTGRFTLWRQDANGSVSLPRSAGPLSSGRLSAIELPYQEGNP